MQGHQEARHPQPGDGLRENETQGPGSAPPPVSTGSKVSGRDIALCCRSDSKGDFPGRVLLKRELQAHVNT